MKGWHLSTVPGVCAYDREHTWKAGVTVLRLQGAGWSRPMDYCWNCGERLHGASEAMGEFSFGPPAASSVRPLAGLAEGFDAKMAQAHDGRDG